MSRNARTPIQPPLPARPFACLLISALLGPILAAAPGPAASSLLLSDLTPMARVVISHDTNATVAFQPRPASLRAMVSSGLTTLTGQPTPQAAWKSLLSTQEVVGIKVFSLPGRNSGTRPEVAAAVVESLLDAGMPPQQIIVWDRQMAHLQEAGFLDLKPRYGIRVEASADHGYDEETFYETSILGNLVFGDAEFGNQAEDAGRKSFVSRLVTKEMTRIINLPPLLNHNQAGVTGNLYSLALDSVDNTIRFRNSPRQLAVAIPEIYALPELGDRVVLNIVDALICQYQGQSRSLLHYAATLNELRFSTDPVALDVLSLAELKRQRQLAGMPASTEFPETYENASLLELGINDPKRIQVEHIP